MTANDKPKISVIMSAYNAASYIDSSINSILNQTFNDFEFIIINDGSTDNTLDKIKKYKDKRIVIINHQNKGLVDSLNIGVKKAKADIIARQDADDISNPYRLEIQYSHLLNNTGVILVGSSISVIDMSGKTLHNHYVLISDAEIRQELLIRSPFAHGSVVFIKKPFFQAGGYKKNEWPAEDYGLWLRMSKFGQFSNINEPLYVYRENPEGISAKNLIRQKNEATKIQKNAWTLRNSLLTQKIDINRYNSLTMGKERQERIAKNIMCILILSLRSGDLKSLVNCTANIFSSKTIIKKCARIILVKIGIKR